MMHRKLLLIACLPLALVTGGCGSRTSSQERDLPAPVSTKISNSRSAPATQRPQVSSWLTPQEKNLLGAGPAHVAEQQLASGLEPLSQNPDNALRDPQLGLVVSMLSTQVSEGQPLEFHAKLVNRSAKPLLVNTTTPPGGNGFQARIFDSSGKVYWGLISQYQGSFVSPRREQFVEIAPGGSIDMALPVKTIRDFDLSQTHVWQTAFPGSFVLTLIFMSRSNSYEVQPGKMTELPDAWTGTIMSESIRYDVKPLQQEASSREAAKGAPQQEFHAIVETFLQECQQAGAQTPAEVEARLGMAELRARESRGEDMEHTDVSTLHPVLRAFWTGGKPPDFDPYRYVAETFVDGDSPYKEQAASLLVVLGYKRKALSGERPGRNERQPAPSADR